MGGNNFNKGQGGAKKINLQFALGARAAAEEAVGKVCLKCRHARAGSTKCKSKQHVREDPNCVLHDSEKWPSAVQATLGEVAGALTNMQASLPVVPECEFVGATVDNPSLPPPPPAQLPRKQLVGNYKNDAHITVEAGPRDDTKYVQTNLAAGAQGYQLLSKKRTITEQVLGGVAQLVAALPRLPTSPPRPGKEPAPPPADVLDGLPSDANINTFVESRVTLLKDSQESEEQDAVVVTVEQPGTSVAPVAGKARSATPPYIVKQMQQLREALGRGDSIAPLPPEFGGKLYARISFDPDKAVTCGASCADLCSANLCAFDECKLWAINWQRQRRKRLPKGRVPCANPECEGNTDATAWGCTGDAPSGIFPILRTDGLFDYCTSVYHATAIHAGRGLTTTTGRW